MTAPVIKRGRLKELHSKDCECGGTLSLLFNKTCWSNNYIQVPYKEWVPLGKPGTIEEYKRRSNHD